MTAFGKALAFLNLVAGIGLAMWSVTVYTNRPPYFDPVPEAIDKGNTPESFKMLAGEIDSLTKAATAAAGAWGEGLKAVEEREKARAYRQGKLAVRLKYAAEGDPAKNGAGFTELVEDPATKLIDVDKFGAVVLGPPPSGETAGQPLRGADRLLDTYNKDVAEIARLAAESKAQRLEERKVAAEVQQTEVRYLKQSDIRENLVNEFAFLSASEVFVYEDRETVFKRKKQLERQLERFAPTKPGN